MTEKIMQPTCLAAVMCPEGNDTRGSPDYSSIHSRVASTLPQCPCLVADFREGIFLSVLRLGFVGICCFCLFTYFPLLVQKKAGNAKQISCRLFSPENFIFSCR